MCTLYCEWMCVCVIWILYSGMIRYHNLFLCSIWEIPYFAEVYQDKKSKVGGKWHSTSTSEGSTSRFAVNMSNSYEAFTMHIYSLKPLISLVFIGIMIQFLILQGQNTTSRPTSPGSHIIPPAPSEGPLVQGNQAWRSHPPAETVDATSDTTGSQSG